MKPHHIAGIQFMCEKCIEYEGFGKTLQVVPSLLNSPWTIYQFLCLKTFSRNSRVLITNTRTLDDESVFINQSGSFPLSMFRPKISAKC